MSCAYIPAAPPLCIDVPAKYRERYGNWIALLCALFLVVLYNAGAQNLVVNPSFEMRVGGTACPAGVSELGPMLQLNCAGWRSANEATPDYFHSCNTNFCYPISMYDRVVGVPTNTFGDQTAYPGDLQQAYAGLVYNPGFNGAGDRTRREYIQGTLSSALKKDQLYNVTFHISLAEGSSFAVKDFGAYLSTGLYDQQGTGALDSIPQVRDSTQFFTDMTGWTQISGVYKAKGDEDHIVIGWFRRTTTPNRDYISVTPAYTACYSVGLPQYAEFAYYYVDNIAVEQACVCGEGGYSVDLPVRETPAAPDDECCFWIDLTRHEGSCDIYGVRTYLLPDTETFSNVYLSGSGAWAHDAGSSPVSYVVWTRNEGPMPTGTERIGGFCIKESATPRRLVIEYLDAESNYMCADTIDIPACLPPDCCEALTPILDAFPSTTGGVCCYSITTPLPEFCEEIEDVRIITLDGTIMVRSDDHSVYNDSLVFGSYDSGGFTYVGGDLCIVMNSGPLPAEPPRWNYPIRIEYLNAEGEVVCTKDTLLTCTCRCDNEFHETRLTPKKDAPEGQCCWDIDLITHLGSCGVYALRIDLVNENGIDSLFYTDQNLTAIDSVRLGQICLDEGVLTGNDSVRVCYYDRWGAIDCCVMLPIRCFDCCDRFNVRSLYRTHEPPPGPGNDPHRCCRNIFITQDSGTTCLINEVRVYGADGGILPSIEYLIFPSSSTPDYLLGQGTPVATYCLDPGETREITVEFLDANGIVRCTKTLIDSCPQRPCCNAINLGFEPHASLPNNPDRRCCESIYATQPSGSTWCQVYGVNVYGADGGIPWDSTRVVSFPSCPNCVRTIVASYCLEPGETRTITIDFLDRQGRVMCTKTVVRSCPPVDSCCDMLGAALVVPDVSFGECCYNVSVYGYPGLNCNVHGIRLVGADGGWQIQGAPIVMPGPGSPLQVGYICGTPGQTDTIVVEFLDLDSTVLCSKTLILDCPLPRRGTGENPPALPIPLHTHPSPATGETMIRYQLDAATPVQLELFDPAGRLVAVVDEGVKAKGTHTLMYNVRTLPPGLYLLRLSTPEGVVSLPLVVSEE